MLKVRKWIWVAEWVSAVAFYVAAGTTASVLGYHWWGGVGVWLLATELVDRHKRG